MKNKILFIIIFSSLFITQVEYSKVFASETSTGENKQIPEKRGFFRNPFKKNTQPKKISEPLNVRPQTPQSSKQTPEEISQGYNVGQERVEEQRRIINEKKQESQPGGFELHPMNRPQVRPQPLSQLPPSQPETLQEKSQPLPSVNQSEDQNIYFQLVRAIKWKISILTDQLRLREKEYIGLPADMRVQLKDLTPSEDNTLINWVYPELVEAMLQLSGASYIRTKVDMEGGEFTEERKIPENIKDSYFLQRKIYEVENELKSREDLKNYIKKYRERLVDLLANHVRLTYDLEPILGINKDSNSTSIQFGMRGSNSNVPSSSTEKLLTPQGPGPNLPSLEETKDDLSSKIPGGSIGVGKLNVVDTGPLVMDYLLKNAAKIFPFKEYFGNQFKIQSVADILSYISRLEALINDEIVSLQRKRKDLDDPNMRIAYGTAEKLALEGFEPQAILYRNTDKAQKEYSGAIFYRDDKIPERCQVSRYPDIEENGQQGVTLPPNQQPGITESGTEQQGISNIPVNQTPLEKKSMSKMTSSPRTNVVRDVMVIAYSGSKSAADWEKNYKFISKETSGVNPLLWGYKIHSGIGEAFEEGYNDLGARVGEMMLKYKRKALTYLNNCPNTRVELHIITTGHSLGGGLSTLAAVAMKKMAQVYNNIEGLSVHVSNISFAAPPVFRKDLSVGSTSDGHQVRYDWADRAEKFIGRGNILRVFVDTDPVATFSLFRQSQKSTHRSLIMTLLKYKHIGIPMMLYDIEGTFDEFSFWNPHMMPRYGLLVSLFANDKYLKVRDYLKGFEDRNQMNEVKLELTKLGNTLKSLEDSMQSLPQVVNTSQGKELTTFLDKLVYENAAYISQYDENKKVDELLRTTKKVVVSDVETLPTGPTVKTTLGKSMIKKLEFTPYFPDDKGDNIFVYSDQPITLTSSTQCSPDTFWKTNIEGKFSLKPGYYPDEAVKTHAACSCCLLKNLVLSQETFGTRARQVLGKKGEIGSIEQAMGHCVQKNYCTSEMIDQQMNFSNYPNQYNAISAWVEKFRGNALEVWRTKQLNVEN